MMPTNDQGPEPIRPIDGPESLAEQCERLTIENAQLRAEVLSLQAALRRLDGERPAM